MNFMEDKKFLMEKLDKRKKRDDVIIFAVAGVLLLSVMIVF